MRLDYFIGVISCILHLTSSQEIFEMKLACENSIEFKASTSSVMTYPQLNILNVSDVNTENVAFSWSQRNEGVYSTMTQLNDLSQPMTPTVITDEYDTLIKVLKNENNGDLVYIYGDFQEEVYYSIYSEDGVQMLPNTQLTSSTVVVPRYQTKVAPLSDNKFVIVWKPSELNAYYSPWKYKIIDMEDANNNLGEFNLTNSSVFDDYFYDNGAICIDDRIGDKDIFTFIWRELSDIYVTMVNATDGSIIIDGYKLSVSVSNLRGFFVCARRNAQYEYEPDQYEYVLCLNAANHHNLLSHYDILCMNLVFDANFSEPASEAFIEETDLALISKMDSRYTWAGFQTIEQEIHMIGSTPYFMLCFVSELNGIAFRATEGSIACSIVNAFDLTDIMVDSYFIAAGDSSYGYDAPSVEIYNDTHFILTYSYSWSDGQVTKLLVNWCQIETIYDILE